MTSPQFKPQPLWQILGDEPPIEWRLEREDRARQAATPPEQPVRTDAGETYGPPTPPLVPMNLPGFGQTYFDPAVVPNMRDFIDRTQGVGMGVEFESGFRTTGGQTTLRDDPNATTPARPGNSLHEAGRAFDIKQFPRSAHGERISNQALERIVEQAREAGFGWGGDFRTPDPGHFFIEAPEGIGNRGPQIQQAQEHYRKWLENK